MLARRLGVAIAGRRTVLTVHGEPVVSTSPLTATGGVVERGVLDHAHSPDVVPRQDRVVAPCRA